MASAFDSNYWDRFVAVNPIRLAPAITLCNLIPDYICLLGTRLVFRYMAKQSGWLVIPILCGDMIVKTVFGVYAIAIGATIRGFVLPEAAIFYALSDVRIGLADPNASVWLFPLFISSVWLWIYCASGFLIKTARRFDIGFEWFNRKFDVDRKPSQSIGLVAGALVALAYWTAAIAIRIFG